MTKTKPSINEVGAEIHGLVREIKIAHGGEAAAVLLMSELHDLLKSDRSAGAEWIRFKTTKFKSIGPMQSDGSWELAQDAKLDLW